MRNFLLVGALVFGLGACSKSAGDEALSKMEGFKNQMCECKDKACAEKVQKEMGEWFEKFAKDNKDKKPEKDKDMEEKASKIMKEMEECTTKAMK